LETLLINHPSYDPNFSPKNDANIRNNSSSIHTASSAQSWFEKHEDALQHLHWPTQAPDLNIAEPLWSVLESTVRSRFPPPPSLKQLEDVLHEEWYTIPLETIPNLHESVTGRVQGLLQTNVGPTPY